MLSEYHILEKMATGSFGVVFKVRRVIDDGVFVMKRIDLSDMDMEQRREAAQEIRVMSRLNHPFVVAQRDAFLFNDDSLCIVMDYYDGGDLDALIARQREKDEYLPMEQAMGWFAGMCLAMQYLHAQGIVHRDLKTHNVFLDLRRKEVAIGDFGVAEFFVNSPEMNKEGGASSTLASSAWQQLFAKKRDSELFGDKSGDGMNGPFGGAVRGTPLYMAPEVLESGAHSPNSDVWSLGCILYELLSLRHPFESRDIAALMMRVMAGVREPLPGHYPPEITQLVDSMLLLDPARRPSCEEILRRPVMSGYLHRLVANYVPCETPDMCVERTWASQLQQLGICNDAPRFHLPIVRETRPTAPPSQERAWAERGATVSPLSPGISTFGDDFPQFQLSPSQPIVNQGDGGLSLPLPGNVDDMRHKPLAHIEEEVARYRQLVQSEMRAQKQLRDAAMQEGRPSGDDVTMEHYYGNFQRSKVATATISGAPFAGQVLVGNVPCLSSSASPPSSPSHGRGNAHRGGVPLPSWPQGSLEASLVERRQRRINTVTRILGDAAFFSVYNYYKSVEVAERKAARVMQMVPDRSRWHVLPLIEEVVVIERLLERVTATYSS